MPSEQRALIAVFAHPDDEFAVFPWLRNACRAGRRIYCVWLTNGGFGGQDPSRRERESVLALRGLGVPPENMIFLGSMLKIEDGALYASLDTCVEGLCSWSQQVLSGQAEVLVPAWEGGHHDHDAAHLAGLRLAWLVGGTARQFSLYHGDGLQGPWFKVMVALVQNGPRSVMRTGPIERVGYVLRCLHFRSQWRSFAGLLPFYAVRLLASDAFALQPAMIRRTLERPHAGPLLYERRGGPSWKEFAQATARYRFTIESTGIDP